MLYVLYAFLAGAASAFAFEPAGLWPLLPVAFAVLCEFICRSKNVWRALLTGWAFGVGQFAIGLNWIATAFTYQSNMPAWLGWIAVVLLSLYLAIYPALATGLSWRFGRDNRVALVLVFGGAWAVTEWLRGTMFTGSRGIRRRQPSRRLRWSRSQHSSAPMACRASWCCSAGPSGSNIAANGCRWS
jgi:apolipoprotein N-acyltransferase